MRFRFCGDLDCPDWILAEVAAMSKLNVQDFNCLLKKLLESIQNNLELSIDSVMKSLEEKSLGFSDIQGITAALHFIVMNSAKYNVDPKSMQQEIEQLGLPKNLASEVTSSYTSISDALREILYQKSYRSNRIDHMEYQVDHVINDEAADNTDNNNDDNVSKIAYIDMSTISTISNGSKSIETRDNFGFEISHDKLKVLIHDLTKTKQLMTTMTNNDK